MIDGVNFSEMGDPVTDFEVTLLLRYQQSPGRLANLAMRLIAEFGPRNGTQAMAAVLDELGSDRIYMAKRRRFFVDFWRVERDRLIVDLASSGQSYAEIARMFGMTRSAVAKRVRCVLPCRTGHRVTGEDGA